MTNCFSYLAVFCVGIALASCGGAQEHGSDESDISGSEEPGAGPTLKDAAFTTAFDEHEKRATAPTSVEFLPDTQEIIFFGTLEGLPRNAKIEVQWKTTTSDRPFYSSRISGSGTTDFFSRYQHLSGNGLNGGQYWAVVYVNGEKAGDAGFRVTDRRSGGLLRVKELTVSLAVAAGTNEAVNPVASFPMGVKQIFASFYVGGLETGNTIRVSWFLDDDMVEQTDLESEGEKRYASSYSHKKGLARGDYAVEVAVEGEMFARRVFQVGDATGGPVIEEASLGTAAGKDRMPKRAMSTFPRKTSAIHCGIRFISAPAGTNVEVQWVDGNEQQLETTSAKTGGSGPSTVGMAWKPGGTLEPGPYKALVVVNGQKMQEIAFTVE